MDITTQKPFVCTTKGCGMTFTNEDHLSVHEKKHEMVLNLSLGNKSSNVFVADQTPTPTRLIKNCEEVGLFDDLKHVNPFDETFRRAIESKNISDIINGFEVPISNDTLLHSDDSLHTPQVYPNGEDNSEKEQEFQVQKEVVILSDEIIVKAKTKKTSNADEQLKSAVKRQDSLKEKLLKQKVAKSNNCQPLEKNLAFHKNMTKHLLPKPKPQLPQFITLGYPNIMPQLPSKPLLLPKPNQNTQKDCVKEKLRQLLDAQKRAGAKLYSITNKTKLKRQSTDEYANKIRENKDRRRAASLRYRKRLKRQQVEIEKKNSELLAENSELKAIVTHLKQILAAHKNCDVSRAVSQGKTIKLPDVIQPPAIQIPPSTVKLIMNIPKMVIQPLAENIIPATAVNSSNIFNNL